MKRMLAIQLRRLADRLDPLAAAALGTPRQWEAAQGDTQILELFRQHQLAQRALNTFEPLPHMDGDDEIIRLLFERLGRLTDQIMALPCVGVGDFAAKAIVDTCGGELFPEWEVGALWSEARALTGAEV